MTTLYSSKNLNEYLDSTAKKKNISESELRKNVSINDFQITRGGSFSFPNVLKAEKELKEFTESHEYDAVMNIKRDFNLKYFGAEYKISAIGVKFRKN